MKRATALGAALLLAIASAAVCAQGAYRWVDKTGKVHYSDEAPEPATARQVETKRLTPSVVGSESLPYEIRRAASLFPVTLYVSSDCGESCRKGRELLARLHIPHTEKAVETPEDAAAYRAATGSEALNVPLLMVGTAIQKGFEETAWIGALDTAGYPVAGGR